MKRYRAYFKYVIHHKYFVFRAGLRLRVPLWALLVHDLSKFLPSEFKAYAETFYTAEGEKQYVETDAFNRAWLLHQHRNRHHWQWHLLKLDRGDIIPLEMPGRCTLEMVADWAGAGRVIKGHWDCSEWYQKNKDIIMLHKRTRPQVGGLVWRTKQWH